MKSIRRKLASRPEWSGFARDVAVVHICLLLTTAAVAIFESSDERLAAMQMLRLGSGAPFGLWMLCCTLPLVFLCSGLYGRVFTGPFQSERLWIMLRAVSISAVVLLSASCVLLDKPYAFTSILIFVGLIAIALPVSRGVHRRKKPARRNGQAGGRLEESGKRDVVLVIGGAGYIGSVLVRKLLASGAKVRVLDSLIYGAEPLEEVLDHPRLELMAGDCRNIQDVACALRSVESVVHLAAIVGDAACREAPEHAVQINFAATRMAIEMAKGAGVSRFVFASSCSVYGATDEEMDESAPSVPVSLYAQTKLDSERDVLEAQSRTFHPTVLRLATVFGDSPRPRFDLAVNLLTAKAHFDGVITVFNGDSWRPFIHVQDVAEGMMAVLKTPACVVSGQIFNLGDSRMNYRICDVADEIQRVFPHTRVEYGDNVDRRNYRVSFAKARDELNFQCTIGLTDGIIEVKRAVEMGWVLNYKDARYNNFTHLQKFGSPACKTALEERLMAAFVNPAQPIATAV
jgi:nucleoside-diphosphate-sugar epimerase